MNPIDQRLKLPSLIPFTQETGDSRNNSEKKTEQVANRQLQIQSAWGNYDRALTASKKIITTSKASNVEDLTKGLTEKLALNSSSSLGSLPTMPPSPPCIEPIDKKETSSTPTTRAPTPINAERSKTLPPIEDRYLIKPSQNNLFKSLMKPS